MLIYKKHPPKKAGIGSVSLCNAGGDIVIRICFVFNQSYLPKRELPTPTSIKLLGIATLFKPMQCQNA